MPTERDTIELSGCTPIPLAHYLKALGILRLVSEQVDTDAKGWWKNDTFCLRSMLDREALAEFFLERYEPTPIVGPWGARSGFYAKSSEQSARVALEKICESKDDRLDTFRTVITETRVVLEKLGLKKRMKQKNANS
jgi:CRISPR-associated protein Csx17